MNDAPNLIVNNSPKIINDANAPTNGATEKNAAVLALPKCRSDNMKNTMLNPYPKSPTKANPDAIAKFGNDNPIINDRQRFVTPAAIPFTEAI